MYISDAFTIVNEMGIHSRFATKVVFCANNFKSNIWIKNMETGKKCNAKSLLSITSAELNKDTKISIMTEGSDECNAATKLLALLKTAD